MEEQLTKLIRIVTNLSEAVIDAAAKSAASSAALGSIHAETLRLLKSKGILTDEEIGKLFGDALASLPENLQAEAQPIFEAAQAALGDGALS